MVDEGKIQEASAGGDGDVAEGEADTSVTSAGNVEGEQREGERTADEFSPSDGAPQPQAEAEGPDDGDELAEPVWIDARTRVNRENATRSTGPTTEEGKRRS